MEAMSAGRRLSPLDAAFLYFDRPEQRLHVGCVAILAGHVPFEALVAAVEQRVVGWHERYRQRPVRPLLDLGLPHWETDPAFDPARHVRHIAVPPPGDEAALHRLIDGLFATRLDPAHPLWQFTLVDGLAGGRAAILCKVHHAMIDGVSGAQLLQALADPLPSAQAILPPWDPNRRPTAPATLPQLLRSALDPTALRAAGRDAAAALGLLASFVTDPPRPAPFNGPLTDARRLVWASLPLDAVLELRGAAGTTVNDVVLAVITGALRRWLAARSAASAPLRVLVPVSVRRSEERHDLGNLVSAMFPRLPVEVADPAERLRRIAAEMRALKEDGQARASGLLLGLAGTLPTALSAAVARLLRDGLVVNTVCTNVPGPREPRRLLGQPILDIHPLVPLFSGMGLEFAIMSYGDRLSICAAADPHLVPDAERLADDLRAALVELQQALAAPAVVAKPASGSPRVADLMTAPAYALLPTATLGDADELMRTHRVRHAPVVDADGRLAGLVSHRDLLAAAASILAVRDVAERKRLLARVRVDVVMETHLSVAQPEQPASEAGARLLRQGIGCLPVIESGGRLVGIVTEADFLRWATTHMDSRASSPRAERTEAGGHRDGHHQTDGMRAGHVGRH